jgi:peptidyl-Lys metalloendopeptidase
MRPSLSRVLVVALSVLALEACAPSDEGSLSSEAQEVRAADLQISLSLAQPAYARHEAVVATVTITNAGKTPVKLLSWFLPDADLEEPLFAVVHDGSPAAFMGPRYKRPAAADADFVKLAAGESLTRTVDVGQWYDLSKSDDYQVRLEVDAGDLRPHDGARGKVLTSNTVSAWIEERPTASPESVVASQVGAAVGYSRCDATQEAQILDAANAATTYSVGARDYLAGAASATPRYTTWFGAFSSAGWNQVHDHFVAIADAFQNKPVVVDCRCKKNYYAYTYPNQPYNIYVCKAFWAAPLTGTDSRAGTLIHEMSHFTVTAGTNDWAYGQTACKSLALSDPTRARDNADSHEYFAENTPFQN